MRTNILKQTRLEFALRDIGINPFKLFSRKWKSVSRILKELSKKWNSLTEDEQDNISFVMGGNKDAADFQMTMKVCNDKT